MERASVDGDSICSLISALYGLYIIEYRKLASYDDINYHVKVKQSSTNRNIPEVSRNGYVLKILNSEDSKSLDFLDVMHEAIEVIHNQGIVTSRPVPSISGNYYTVKRLPTQSAYRTGRIFEEHDLEDDEMEAILIQRRLDEGTPPCDFVVRLFEFVPGEILKGKPFTSELCYQVGQLAGEIDKALKDFCRPILTGHKRYWSLTNVPELTKKIHAVDNAEKRTVVEATIKQFEDHVVSNYDKMKRGTIHADINNENIIVLNKHTSNNSTQGSNPEPKYAVHGVIDFGDLVHDFPVFELGIVISYMMTYSHVIDPIEAGGHVLAGYLTEYSIPKFDLVCLKECVAGRLAQSLVNGEYAYKQNPDDIYCVESAREAWPLLKRLHGISKKELYSKWQTVLYLYNMDNPFLQN